MENRFYAKRKSFGVSLFFNLKVSTLSKQNLKCLEFCVLLYNDKIIFISKYVLNFSIQVFVILKMSSGICFVYIIV